MGSLSGKSLGMGSSVFDSESNAAGSGPKLSGVSVKSTAGLGVNIGTCCYEVWRSWLPANFLMLHQGGSTSATRYRSRDTLVKVRSEIIYVTHAQIRECRKSARWAFCSFTMNMVLLSELLLRRNKLMVSNR